MSVQKYFDLKMKKDKQQTKAPTGTQEWAHRNVNIVSGCMHGCSYCYAQTMSIRFGRNTPESWLEEKVDWDKVNKNYRRVPSDARHDIMFPTTHDISPSILEPCITVLRNMLENGNTVLIVTKPHISCIKRICEEFSDFKDQITFRFSIGSVSDEVLKTWEPNAPRFNHRMKCLEYAHELGFNTSVSCEPLLDGNGSDLVNAVLPYVTDTVWLGKPNRLVSCVSMNTGKDDSAIQASRDLNAVMSEDYFKSLYEEFGANEKIRWKDTIKEMLGLERPQTKGMDV